MGAQQGHLVEGYSIPYRALIENAPTGIPISVDIGYDIKHSGAHAIDFLTHYSRLGGATHNGSFGHDAEDFLPTTGTGVSAAQVSELAFPAPSVLKGGQPLARFSQLPAGERVMSLFGGTITGIAYLDQGNLDAAQSEASIRVTVTLTSPNAVLAWGGHIARSPDWNGLSASAISGSPYHMRLKAWSAGNVGNQDRSLSADAVIAIQPGVTTSLTEVGTTNTGAMITVTVGASVVDSATLTGATPDAGGKHVWL